MYLTVDTRCEECGVRFNYCIRSEELYQQKDGIHYICDLCLYPERFLKGAPTSEALFIVYCNHCGTSFQATRQNVFMVDNELPLFLCGKCINERT